MKNIRNRKSKCCGHIKKVKCNNEESSKKKKKKLKEKKKMQESNNNKHVWAGSSMPWGLCKSKRHVGEPLQPTFHGMCVCVVQVDGSETVGDFFCFCFCF